MLEQTGSVLERTEKNTFQHTGKMDPVCSLSLTLENGHTTLESKILEIINYYKNTTDYFFPMTYESPNSFNTLLGLEYNMYKQLMVSKGFMQARKWKGDTIFKIKSDALYNLANIKYAIIEISDYRTKGNTRHTFIRFCFKQKLTIEMQFEPKNNVFPPLITSQNVRPVLKSFLQVPLNKTNTTSNLEAAHSRTNESLLPGKCTNTFKSDLEDLLIKHFPTNSKVINANEWEDREISVSSLSIKRKATIIMVLLRTLVNNNKASAIAVIDRMLKR